MTPLAVRMFGGDYNDCTHKGEQNEPSYISCAQPLEGAEGSCLSGESWLIFTEFQLSTACTIIMEEGKALGRQACIWSATLEDLLPLRNTEGSFQEQAVCPRHRCCTPSPRNP